LDNQDENDNDENENYSNYGRGHKIEFREVEMYQLTVRATVPFLTAFSTAANFICKPCDPRTVSNKFCTFCSSVTKTLVRIRSTVSDAVFA
jgi:hypothetical protein